MPEHTAVAEANLRSVFDEGRLTKKFRIIPIVGNNFVAMILDTGLFVAATGNTALFAPSDFIGHSARRQTPDARHQRHDVTRLQ